MNKTTQLLFSLGFNLVINGCGSRELHVPSSEAFPPTFKSIRRRILEPRCVSCHTSLVSHQMVIQDWVRPGNPSRSQLYTIVQSGEMPLYGEKLKDPELESLKTWIIQGAPND